MKKLIRGVKGVENIYTQENFPFVHDIFEISWDKILNVLSVTSVKFQKHIPSFKSLIEKVCQGKSDPRLKTFGANPQTPLVSIYEFKDRARTEQHLICVGWVYFQSKDVIVFISGGVTYEESFHIYRLNKELQDQSRIVIGGNIIHNSRSFLNDILYHRNRSS